jgi:putative transposase
VFTAILKDLDRAFRNFFVGKSQYPKFKKKGRHDSFRIPCQRVRVDQEKKMVSPQSRLGKISQKP